MNDPRLVSTITVVTALALVAAWVPVPAHAASAEEIAASAQVALGKLYAKSPKAKALAKDAVAILVFPKITKAGFVVGGQYGEGVLYQRGKVTGYYSTAGASVGLQAGGQTYGYVLFFFSKETLAYLHKSDGFELGVGPSLVVADDGFAKSTSTTTVKDNIYAFIFDQKGAMAALGIQGNKISKLKK